MGKALEGSDSEGFTTSPTEFFPPLPLPTSTISTMEAGGGGGGVQSEVSSEAWCTWRRQIWARFFC